MTLPIDFKTSMWLTWKPVWEWETVPQPATDASPGGVATEAGADPVETAGSGEERRLVFKGFEVSGSLYWFHADSPLSRPWLAPRDDDEPARRERVASAVPDTAGTAGAAASAAIPTPLARDNGPAD